jgi:hypothetical protein
MCLGRQLCFLDILLAYRCMVTPTERRSFTLITLEMASRPMSSKIKLPGQIHSTAESLSYTFHIGSLVDGSRTGPALFVPFEAAWSVSGLSRFRLRIFSKDAGNSVSIASDSRTETHTYLSISKGEGLNHVDSCISITVREKPAPVGLFRMTTA